MNRWIMVSDIGIKPICSSKLILNLLYLSFLTFNPLNNIPFAIPDCYYAGNHCNNTGNRCNN